MDSALLLAAEEGETSNFLIPNGTFIVELIIFLIVLGGQAIGMRSMCIYELGTDYVKYAKLLGIKEHKILFYMFRNAMLPQPMMPSLRFIATRLTSTAADAGAMVEPEAEG